MNHKNIYNLARRRVRKKKGFISHLTSWIAVSLFLITINLFTSPGYFWAIFPISGWGLGLVFHALSVYNSSEMSHDWEQRELRREMKRLEGDKSYEDDEYLELKDLKELQPKYRDSDFV